MTAIPPLTFLLTLAATTMAAGGIPAAATTPTPSAHLRQLPVAPCTTFRHACPHVFDAGTACEASTVSVIGIVGDETLFLAVFDGRADEHSFHAECGVILGQKHADEPTVLWIQEEQFMGRTAFEARITRVPKGIFIELSDAMGGSSGAFQNLLMRHDSGWRPLECVKMEDLSSCIPPGWWVADHPWVDLARFRGSVGVVGPDDSHASPTGRADFSVRLLGDRFIVTQCKFSRRK